ncbi:MAG: sigma-70 family RNA polymerase sigma factor [Planctomycetota bacterium]|nr:sigma-70 family RNA polymerase sigma factor [Planctomycetota bacterium]
MQTATPSSCCQEALAQDQLLTDHLPALRALGRRLLGCDHLADDCVQEALVALWKAHPRPENARAWLARAVVLRSRQLRRSLRRRSHHEHVATQDCERHVGCDNPLHIAMAHEVGERLRAVLDTLPESQRTAYELYERTGLDYAGVAEKLKLPIGTVRSRLHRARAAISAALS